MILLALTREDDGTEEAVLELANGAKVYVKQTRQGCIIDVYPNDDVSDSVGSLILENEDLVDLRNVDDEFSDPNAYTAEGGSRDERLRTTD